MVRSGFFAVCENGSHGCRHTPPAAAAFRQPFSTNSWKLETQLAKLAAALFFTPPPQLHGKQSPFSADFAAKRMDFAASSEAARLTWNCERRAAHMTVNHNHYFLRENAPSPFVHQFRQIKATNGGNCRSSRRQCCTGKRNRHRWNQQLFPRKDVINQPVLDGLLSR